MAFGKPGRPPEDRMARQCEIFAAVSPLLLNVGVRRFSMRQAAQTACLSVGGLYHYFPTKRALVLHGVQPATLARMCEDYFHGWESLAEADPQGYREALQASLERAVAFVRPSVYAAFTLGDAAFHAAVEATIRSSLDRLLGCLQLASIAGSDGQVQALARGLRRACLGAILDPSVTAEEFAEELDALLHACCAWLASSTTGPDGLTGRAEHEGGEGTVVGAVPAQEAIRAARSTSE